MMHRLPLLFAVALLGTHASAQGGPPTRDARRQQAPAAIRLHDGRNSLDLLGTGDAGAVDVADRENFNAHGFHVAIFHVRARIAPGDSTSAIAWQVVPFFGGFADSVSGDEVFRTSEGADCTLRDLRVLRTAGRPVQIVVAQREFGESFADSAPVVFHYYELRQNRDGIVGYPAYYFAAVRTVSARRRYCDVDDAFQQELGLGRAGILVWDGPR